MSARPDQDPNCLQRLSADDKSRLYSKFKNEFGVRSSLFWVHAVCFYTKFVSNVRQLFAADDFSRRHFQMHFFFLGALRVNCLLALLHANDCLKTV